MIGNGTIEADKAIAFGNTVSINKSAVDGHNTLTIKTTGADNGNIGGGRSINLNSSIVQAGADDVKLVVDSYSSLYANATGSIGSSTAGLGKLDVDMTARGLDQSGNAASVYSLGMTLSKVINANGGTVTLTANQGNTNAGSGGAAGALIFSNGAGITAGNFTVTGSYTGGSINASRAGIVTGNNTFTITGEGTGVFNGATNTSNTPWSVGLYTAGALNLNAGTGQIRLQAAVTRYEANINTNASGMGAVTLGGDDRLLVSASRHHHSPDRDLKHHGQPGLYIQLCCCHQRQQRHDHQPDGARCRVDLWPSVCRGYGVDWRGRWLDWIHTQHQCRQTDRPNQPGLRCYRWYTQLWRWNNHHSQLHLGHTDQCGRK